MATPYIHTLIGPENSQGGLLICGINHGHSLEDERKEAAGIDRSDKHKSFFSDAEVCDDIFRNRIATCFELWGHKLHSDKQLASVFEKSLIRINWLNTVSREFKNIDCRRACIDDHSDFIEVATLLRPKLIFFFGSGLLPAFTSNELHEKITGIFGSPLGQTSYLQKEVVFEGRKRRRFRFGFQNYENLAIVSCPHATGSQGLANDYIAAFKPEISQIIGSWWEKHSQALQQRI
jgi:hypothetical protein